MIIETQLPLGKIDPGLRAPPTPLDIASVGEQARLAEALGDDAIAGKLKARFAGRATHLQFAIPAVGEADQAVLRDPPRVGSAPSPPIGGRAPG
jgi:hypothetical protein